VWFLYGIVAVWLIVGFSVIGHVVWMTGSKGGKVSVKDWGFPELLMSFVLAGFFTMLMVNAITRQAKGQEKLSIESVMPSSLIFLILTVGILLFLHYGRRFKLVETFGIRNVHPLAAIGWAIGLLVAALPLTGVANVITLSLMKSAVTPQPLIELFSEVARKGDYLSMAKIFFAGVIVAPCCEEFLFRGFFYGVWKRYLPPLAAGFVACLLFAAFHTSLMAFAGLFVLAACLTLAYERTGSLLVPIGIHALFNFTSLSLLYLQALFPKIPLPS
jgi:membrane protease YdiL (CAAX protease family)